MTTQSRQTSEFTDLTTHVHLILDACPTCGQEIPAEKIEEIGGRIATREREQALAITLELEKQFAIEKSAAEAKANADLESERQQSAIREQQAQDEAQRAAEKFINERQAQIDRERTALVAGWEQRLAESESARTAAQQTEASLQAEIIELRKETAGAIEAVKAEAKVREVQIQDQAKQSAESAAAERIKQIEAKHHESEAALEARITAAEANRITAEKNKSILVSQLEELQRTKDTEVDKVRQEAAADLLRVRQIASDDAEARFRDKLAVQENAAAEATTKAREAETKLQEFTDQQATELEAQLKAQREVLEKSKEDAVNAEKAKAFDENQKLSTKVTDLQRALENKTAEELGEGAEVKLFDELKREFPEDDIRRVPKGSAGADIIHVVMLCGKKCGTIIYDSKDHDQFRSEHVTKLRADQLAEGAEHAILATRKLPRGTRQLELRDGVLLANPARVVVVATLIRQHLIQLHSLRISNIECDKKTAALYEFIVSERCSSVLARIDERADYLLEEQKKEITWHKNNWNRQGEAIRAIQKAKADLEHQVSSIIGTSASDAAA
jgi:Uncharacterized protein conserved in bacteria (DUF2130)